MKYQVSTEGCQLNAATTTISRSAQTRAAQASNLSRRYPRITSSLSRRDPRSTSKCCCKTRKAQAKVAGGPTVVAIITRVAAAAVNVKAEFGVVDLVVEVTDVPVVLVHDGVVALHSQAIHQKRSLEKPAGCW